MDFSTVKAEIQKGYKLFKAFEHGAEVVTVIEGLAQNEKELKASIEKLKKEAAGYEAQVSNATQALAEIDEEAKLVKAMAQEEAAKIVADAKSDAKKLLDDAATEAAIYGSDAESKKSEVKQASDELAAIEIKISKAKQLAEKQMAALKGL